MALTKQKAYTLKLTRRPENNKNIINNINEWMTCHSMTWMNEWMNEWMPLNDLNEW